MRVLVTGATGYLGAAVVQRLLEDRHDVVALVRGPHAALPAGVDRRHADLLDEAAMRAAAAGVDAACHLAALARVREAAADPIRCWRVNLAGTLNLLAAAPPRMVFLSTGAVYGAPAAQPIAEAAPFAPLNPYGAAKAAAEQAIAAQAATGALGAVSLRLFNAAGGYDPDQARIIPRAVSAAMGDAPAVSVNGDGSAVRDFVHVSDVAAAVSLALDAVAPGGYRAYNLGAVPASVADVLAATERVTGRPVPVEFGPPHPGEAPELRADTTRIRAELGWAPRYTTLDSLVHGQWAGRPGRRPGRPELP